MIYFCQFCQIFHTLFSIMITKSKYYCYYIIYFKMINVTFVVAMTQCIQVLKNKRIPIWPFIDMY